MGLSARLRAARHARFVGRSAECAAFLEALGRADEPPFVLYVHGEGGVGKTSLLHEMRYLAEEAGLAAHYLDARALVPTPEALEQAVAEDAGELASASEPVALLIDTYERLADLDEWVRGTWLPSLPEHVVVVIAGRKSPPPAWHADPGWRAVTRFIPLQNLSEDESRGLLAASGVPEAAHPGVLAFTEGHPLALALVAEAHRQTADDVTPAPDALSVVAGLVARFAEEVPSEQHRRALELAALARATTEGLLAAVLDPDDPAALFAWLRALSFMETGPEGAFPHDLARAALQTDLLARAPDRHRDLLARARRYYTGQLRRENGPAQQRRVLTDYAFLYQGDPVAGPILTQLRTLWAESGSITGGLARPDEHAALRALVARHEGEASAALFDRWFDCPYADVRVFRQGDTPEGLLCGLSLDRATPADRAADPAVEATLSYLEDHAPLREGERAVLFRTWLDAEAYQDISPVQSLIFASTVWTYLSTDRLAFTFLPCAEPEAWASLLAFADVRRLPEADFSVGGRRYGAFGHDWRAVPPEAWLDTLARRDGTPEPAAAPAPEAVILRRDAFAEAVKEALKDYPRLDRLRQSPLLRSRMVRAASGPDADDAARAEALQTLLWEASAQQVDAPRSAKYHRAVLMTYLKPAPTQAEAAERLGTPFSSYRRHLQRGIDHVTDALWQREIGQS